MLEGYFEDRREAFELATYTAWQGAQLGHCDPKKFPTLAQLLKPAKAAPTKKTAEELLGTLRGMQASGVPMRIRRLDR